MKLTSENFNNGDYVAAEYILSEACGIGSDTAVAVPF